MDSSTSEGLNTRCSKMALGNGPFLLTAQYQMSPIYNGWNWPAFGIAVEKYGFGFYWRVPVVNKRERSDKSYENDNLDNKRDLWIFCLASSESMFLNLINLSV